MQPQLKQFRVFYSGNTRFVVPVYQRPYEWKIDKWADFWRDVSYLYIESQTSGADGSIKKIIANHFMGTLITEPENNIGAGDIASYRIVDGQQRLVTVFALLCAIRDYEAYCRDIPIKEQNALYHIIDPDRPDPSPPTRLLVQKRDQEVLAIIGSGLAGKKGTVPHAHNLFKAYEYFLYKLWSGSESMLEALLAPGKADQFLPPPLPKHEYEEKTIWDYWISKGFNPGKDLISLDELKRIITQKLYVLELLLDASDEDAALIFESVNSKTQQLHQFDHIKNSIFVRLPTQRDVVFQKYWDPTISLLEKVSYSGKRSDAGDQFIYDFLIARGEAQGNKTVVRQRGYSQFMQHLDTHVIGPASRPGYESDFLDYLKDNILRAASFWPLAVGQSLEATFNSTRFRLDREIGKTIHSIMELSAGPPAPVVLHLLEGYALKKLTEDNLREALECIESFVARHCLVGTSLSPFRSLFMQLMADYCNTYEISTLISELEKKGWPSDKQLGIKAREVNLYDRLQARQVNALLRGLEEQLSGAGAHAMEFGKGKGQYSIEHILPQSPPSEEWINDLSKWGVKGKKFHDLMEKRHQLGNLTAISNKDNKHLGTKPFLSKRDVLLHSVAPLRLHESITKYRKWTADQVDERTDVLVGAAVKRWQKP